MITKPTLQAVSIDVFTATAMGLASAENADVKKTPAVPAQAFDLRHVIFVASVKGARTKNTSNTRSDSPYRLDYHA